MTTDQATIFNLVDARWLPVRRRSGAVERIAPWQVTDRCDDDPIVAFDWPRPDFNGAAHELLIALLCTTAAPEDEYAWDAWWLDPPTPETLRQRFSRVALAFDLDGHGARFLQDIDSLDDAETKDVTALLIDAPGAQTLRNNADLFVKRREAPVFGRATAAMALFTLCSYAPAGGAGHRTSLRGGGPMTTLVTAQHPRLGNTLWGRLWPNVLGQEDGGKLPDTPTAAVFPWLDATRTSDPKEGGRATTPNDVHPLHVYWAMPRRIRLVFETSGGRRCSVTDTEDRIIVSGFRTRNYGANYSEGFEHPLTPYYRQKAGVVTKLAVHPNAGGITYRLWPGLVVPSSDGLRQPARVVRQWHQERRSEANEGTEGTARFVAFGYDMDNMKACAWVEGEMPLMRCGAAIRARLQPFIDRAAAGAEMAARLLIRSVKSARYDRPKDAPGDYGHIAGRFYRQTEAQFYRALYDAEVSIRSAPEDEDPASDNRARWASTIATAAEWLFDEYVPMEGMEDRNMHRQVAARFQLKLALGGRGKDGRALYERALDIPAPKAHKPSSRKGEVA